MALALHACAILLFFGLAPRGTGASQPPEVMQLVFDEPPPQQHHSDTPHDFTELPEDRKDAAPNAPKLLSNVTSRSRDHVPGGNTALPRLQGDADVPMVKLESRDGSPRPTAAPSPARQPDEPAAHAPESSRENDALNQSAPAATPTASSRSAARDTLRAASGESHGSPGTEGELDFPQPEMANPEGDAPLTGDVSLSTTAWNYAPWLQRFGRQLMRRWIPPTAYTLGILKEGGWALIQMEISRSGKLLRLQLLDERGHPSLSEAAQTALRLMVPIEPLPADFPEPTLILRVRMIYPAVRRG